MAVFDIKKKKTVYNIKSAIEECNCNQYNLIQERRLKMYSLISTIHCIGNISKLGIVHTQKYICKWKIIGIQLWTV